MFKKIICLLFLSLFANATFAGDLVQCPEAKDWVPSDKPAYYSLIFQRSAREWTLSPAKTAEGWKGSAGFPIEITKLSGKSYSVLIPTTNENLKEYATPSCMLILQDEEDGTVLSSHNDKPVNLTTLKNFQRINSYDSFDTMTWKSYYWCGDNCSWEWR